MSNYTNNLYFFGKFKVVLHTKRNYSNFIELQGDPGGTVSMLGGQCEINVYMNMYLILDGYRDRAVRIYKCKLIMNANE